MSTLMLASASGAKIAATAPGLSGRPVRVIRASFLSWAMPVMSCRSMFIFLDCVVADDHRAGPVLERGEDLERHVVAHGEADRAGLQHLGADQASSSISS